jgi:hypothetical protein
MFVLKVWQRIAQNGFRKINLIAQNFFQIFKLEGTPVLREAWKIKIPIRFFNLRDCSSLIDRV